VDIKAERKTLSRVLPSGFVEKFSDPGQLKIVAV
jgi:hypothetical protein